MNVLEVLKTIEVLEGKIQLCVLVKEYISKIKSEEESIYDKELGNNLNTICDEALVQLDTLHQSMLGDLKTIHKSEVKVDSGKSKGPRTRKTSSKTTATKSSGAGSRKSK